MLVVLLIYKKVSIKNLNKGLLITKMKNKKGFVMNQTAMWILLLMTFLVILAIIYFWATPSLNASTDIIRFR
jgi:hypothetical protein